MIRIREDKIQDFYRNTSRVSELGAIRTGRVFWYRLRVLKLALIIKLYK